MRTKSQLVRQVVVLALVFGAVAFAVAVPLRDYLNQRTELAATVASEQQMQAQLAALKAQQSALSDPAYVLSEAKRRLQYVQPGDTVYVVHAPALPAAKPAAGAKPAVTTPWYSQLWDTLSDPTVTAKPAAPQQDPAPSKPLPSSSSASPGAAGTAPSSRAGR